MTSCTFVPAYLCGDYTGLPLAFRQCDNALAMEDAREYVVMVDALTVEGSTYSRGEKIAGNRLAAYTRRLLDACLVRLSQEDVSSTEGASVPPTE
jgi:hypothetical protein